MATTGIVVSVSMGVMKPLLSKLATLMGDKYKKLKGVRKQVSFLEDELTTMNAFLETLELMDDDLDPLAKEWRSHVREMAYDIEDCIDDFLHNFESIDGPDESKEGFVKKAARRLRTLRVRHRIANQIDELKARVLEAGKRHKRYKVDEKVRTSGPSSSVAIDPCVKTLYTEAANPISVVAMPLEDRVVDSEPQSPRQSGPSTFEFQMGEIRPNPLVNRGRKKKSGRAASTVSLPTTVVNPSSPLVESSVKRSTRLNKIDG